MPFGCCLIGSVAALLYLNVKIPLGKNLLKPILSYLIQTSQRWILRFLAILCIRVEDFVQHLRALQPPCCKIFVYQLSQYFSFGSPENHQFHCEVLSRDEGRGGSRQFV